MAGKRLLDSSAVVALFRGDEAVVERIGEVDVAISLVVVGELRFGVFNAGRRQVTLEQLEAFILDCEILTLTATTSLIYGELKAAQLRIGKEIPDNDLWIAASAKEHGLVLAHRDKHFPMIPDFDHEVW
jgi:predicted nucleic acid-binding protein